MAVRVGDTIKPLNDADFPVVEAVDITFTDGVTLQEKFDNQELGGGATYIELSQEEYDALSDEEKNNGSEYRTYDTGNIYKNGVLYGSKEPIELTFAEYKQLEADGLVDPDTDYIVTQDESGILLGKFLLEGSDIGYNNSASGIDATNIQGAIDKVVENINEVSENVESALQTSKNVGLTNIVGTSYIDTSGVNRYCVINGICYVTLEFTVLTGGSLWDGRSFFETLLPAPKIQQDIFYDGTQRLLVGANGTIHGDMTKDKKIYISFSYPVA